MFGNSNNLNSRGPFDQSNNTSTSGGLFGGNFKVMDLRAQIKLNKANNQNSNSGGLPGSPSGDGLFGGNAKFMDFGA